MLKFTSSGVCRIYHMFMSPVPLKCATFIAEICSADPQRGGRGRRGRNRTGVWVWERDRGGQSACSAARKIREAAQCGQQNLQPDWGN